MAKQSKATKVFNVVRPIIENVGQKDAAAAEARELFVDGCWAEYGKQAYRVCVSPSTEGKHGGVLSEAQFTSLKHGYIIGRYPQHATLFTMSNEEHYNLKRDKGAKMFSELDKGEQNAANKIINAARRKLIQNNGSYVGKDLRRMVVQRILEECGKAATIKEIAVIEKYLDENTTLIQAYTKWAKGDPLPTDGSNGSETPDGTDQGISTKTGDTKINECFIKLVKLLQDAESADGSLPDAIKLVQDAHKAYVTKA